MADTIRIPLGANAKMYIGNEEVKIARDVTLTLEKGEANVTTRGSGGWEEVLATNKKASIEFDILWDKQDSSFKKLAKAFFDDEILEFKFLDGEGGTGLHAWCGVFKFSRTEGLEEALMAQCMVKPTYAGSDDTKKPKWVDGTTPP